VVADRRRRHIERLEQVAHARFSAVVTGDQRQQPQPHRIRERLEQRRQLVGPRLRQWLARQRRATLARVGLYQRQQILINHPSNLTHL
jgi:hypothetical protein